MGFDENIARSSVRISLSAEQSDKDIDYVCEQLPLVINQIRHGRELADRVLPRLN
jgi:cysteine sulfinate desulfinase/cysteine desulfurase-like protein